MKAKRVEKSKDDSNRRQFLGTIGGAAAATIAAGSVVAVTGKTGQAAADDCEVGAVAGACGVAVDKMRNDGRTVQVLGRVHKGKVIFDQKSLEDFARAYPNADMAFVAVNAPFDPVAVSNN